MSHLHRKITRENEILQQLPSSLQTEIAVSVHLPTLSKVTIFQNCETSLLEELVLKLTPQVKVILWAKGHRSSEVTTQGETHLQPFSLEWA